MLAFRSIVASSSSSTSSASVAATTDRRPTAATAAAKWRRFPRHLCRCLFFALFLYRLSTKKVKDDQGDYFVWQAPQQDAHAAAAAAYPRTPYKCTAAPPVDLFYPAARKRTYSGR